MSAGSFLDRWSQRKAAVRDGAPDLDPASEPEAGPAPEVGGTDLEPVDEDTLGDADLAERHGLPDPEAMQAGDDVAAFMRAGVPARLRRLALRRLLRLNPEIVAHDGLTDYADDYTDAATVVPGMKTLYQVGRGAAAHLQDIAGRLAGPEAAADGAEEGTAEPVALVEPPLVEPAAIADAGGSPPDPEAERAPARRAPRRHMAFTAPGDDGRVG